MTASLTAMIWLAAGWAVIVAGGLLLVWALFRDRARGRRRCPKCWYDMAGVPGLKCPECGREAKSGRRLHRTRRRWGLAVVAVVLGLAGAVSVRVPRALEHGWLDAVPVVLLRPALWWERERGEELCDQSLTIYLNFGKSQWERLLIASEIERRLASPFDSQCHARFHLAFEVNRLIELLSQLDRESRVAAWVLDESSNLQPIEALAEMRESTIAGRADHRSELFAIARRVTRSRQAVEASMALVDIGLATGRPAASDLIDLLAYQSRQVLDQTLIRCTPASNEYAKSMVREVLTHQALEVRERGYIYLVGWSGEVDWCEPYIRFFEWSETERFHRAALCQVALRFSTVPRDWPPAIAGLLEVHQEDEPWGLNELFFSWLAQESDAAESLQHWLAQLDQTSPRQDGTPRVRAKWLCDVLFSGPSAPNPYRLSVLHKGLTPQEFVEIIQSDLLKYGDEQFISTAVKFVRASPDAEVTEGFIRALRDRYPSTAMQCVLLDAIARSQGDKSAIRAFVLESLQSAEEAVLINACGAAAFLQPSDEVVERILPLTRHENAWIARAASAALQQLQREEESEAVP